MQCNEHSMICRINHGLLSPVCLGGKGMDATQYMKPWEDSPVRCLDVTTPWERDFSTYFTHMS